MGFLVPAMLAALAAIGVPLVLHLRRHDDRRSVPFPSLMFLRRIPVASERRRRITDLPLLLARLALLVLVALAFARPYLRGGGGTSAPAGLLVLLVDRSQSMAHPAVQAARADSVGALLAATDRGTPVAVVGYDADAELLLAPTLDRAAVRAALEAAGPRAAPGRHAAGLRAAARLLEGHAIPGEVAWLTDRQGTLPAGPPVAFPEGARVRLVDVGAGDRDNAAVVGVTAVPVATAEGAPRAADVVVSLRRSGAPDAAPRRAMLSLAVDGRVVREDSVVLPSTGEAEATFAAVALPRTEAHLEARLDPDVHSVDDRFHALVAADAGVRVALVAGPGRDAGVAFVERALMVGGAPGFVVERVAGLDAAVLDRSAVVWFGGEPALDPTTAAALATWVEGGGGLVGTASPAGAAPPFAAALRGTTERADARLGMPATTHPALAAFRGADPDPLAGVRIRRVPVVEPLGGGTEVLLRYDDGTPALVVAARGAGRAVALGVPTGAEAGDFPLHPTFVPVVRGIAVWAAGRAGGALAHAAGEPWLVPAGLAAPALRTPAGRVVPLEGGAAVLPGEAGIHVVEERGTPGVPVARIAVNAPAGEADLTPQPVAALAAIGGGDSARAAAPPAPAELEARQGGWRWLLLLAALLLAGEGWLASRGWRGVAMVTPTGGGTA